MDNYSCREKNSDTRTYKTERKKERTSKYLDLKEERKKPKRVNHLKNRKN